MSNSKLKRKYEIDDDLNSIPYRSEILNRKLSCRPDRHQLIEQGILHDSQCAPSLQHAEHALKRARLIDQLNHRLSNRPGPIDLIEKNILHLSDDYSHEEQIFNDLLQNEETLPKTDRTSPGRTSASTRRPLIFHEYSGPPSSCKPKITKVDYPMDSKYSNAHQIRLAQQQLYLELTSNKMNGTDKTSSIEEKPLEELTLNQLKDLCRKYHLASSHANKSQLIQRIQSFRASSESKEEKSTEEEEEERNDDEIEYLSPAELDEILRSFPPSTNITDDDQAFFSQLIDPQSITNHEDDLFVQMLLDIPNSSEPQSIFEDFLYSDKGTPSPLPKITTLDEFDAFLRDFTNYSSSSSSSSFPQISTTTN